MNLVLLVIGLLATAAGCVTIGFGIPINAFSLGNTLIIAGTIALATGLILIGLAAAIGQLRRIAEALNSGSPPRMGRPAESVESLVPQSARIAPAADAPPFPPRMPAPPKPTEMRDPFADETPTPEPRFPTPEPRFPVTAPSHATSEQPEPAGPLDWLRAKPKSTASAPASAAEPPMVELQDEAPLSPRAPQRPIMPPVPEPTAEPKVWSPSRGSAQAEVRPATQAMPRATPQVERPKANDGFDMVWPEQAGAPVQTAEPVRREANVEAPQAPPRSERRAEAPPPKPASERSPAILKSGVIDGMPYTLYADGSIEAELPQGTVKFASVDALRAHLEKDA